MNKITLSDLGEGELMSAELKVALENIGVYAHYNGMMVTIENVRAEDMLDDVELEVGIANPSKVVLSDFADIAMKWRQDYFQPEKGELRHDLPPPRTKREVNATTWGPPQTFLYAPPTKPIAGNGWDEPSHGIKYGPAWSPGLEPDDMAAHVAAHKTSFEQACAEWGDPLRKVQFIDTYERFIPSKPKEARDITISRTLLCEGKFDEVDVELLEQEVSANYHPFQYGGEYLSAWGYEPSTDEVTLRFLKGQS